MAMLRETEGPTRVPPTQPSDEAQQPAEDRSTSLAEVDEKKYVKGLRMVRIFPNLIALPTDVSERVLSHTGLLVCCWERGTRILMMRNRSSMCFHCSSSWSSFQDGIKGV